ncbi:MAG: lipopolysaccharide assembly protein LapA domain-containing protein [Gammaproteobacteria bacterium]
MDKLTRILVWCFIFIVFVVSIVFSFSNTQTIALSFGITTLAPQPLAVWVIASFAIGGVLGLLLGIGLVKNLRTKLEIKRLRNQVNKLEQTLAHEREKRVANEVTVKP